MSIQLIVTADDCGLSEGIHESTSQLHELGIISSASIMTNFPKAQEAFEIFASYPNLELGVHLNLSDGYPLTQAAKQSELTRGNSKFRNQFLLYTQLLFPSNGLLDSIREELREQIEVFLLAGLQPAHLTTHCHFHIFPAVRKIVYELGNEYNVAWVRTSDYRLSVLPFNPAINKEPAEDEVPHQFLVPDYLVPLKQWIDEPPQALVEEILTLQGTVEIIAHPSPERDESYPSDVRYSPQKRYQETRFLEAFAEVIQPYLRHEIVLSNSLHEPRSEG